MEIILVLGGVGICVYVIFKTLKSPLNEQTNIPFED
jgi:hypothetical protein